MSVSRRRVLAALAAAGGAGALTGTGTVATFTDTEGFRASLTSGVIDLVVEYELRTGPGAGDPDIGFGTVDGPRLHVPVGELDATDPAGSMLVTFALPQERDVVNNPAALWLAADCPTPAATTLGEALRLTLSYADCETGDPTARIADGSLREVADGLQDGFRVDGDPTTDGDDCLTDTVCLLVEYELVGYVGDGSVDLPLWFSAVQCRNTTPRNPFANRETAPCPPGELCPCCRTLGKLEFEDGTQAGLGESHATPGTYAFTEGDTRYGLEIYDTAESGGETTGVAFRLVRLNDPDAVVPRLCTVAVKGGPEFEQYDRDDDTLDDTAGLPGSDERGLVYAPDGKGISHITVCICTTEPEADCPGCTDPSLTNSEGGGAGDGGGGPGDPTSGDTSDDEVEQ